MPVIKSNNSSFSISVLVINSFCLCGFHVNTEKRTHSCKLFHVHFRLHWFLSRFLCNAIATMWTCLHMQITHTHARLYDERLLECMCTYYRSNRAGRAHTAHQYACSNRCNRCTNCLFVVMHIPLSAYRAHTHKRIVCSIRACSAFFAFGGYTATQYAHPKETCVSDACVMDTCMMHLYRLF